MLAVFKTFESYQMILSLSYSKPGLRTHAIFEGIANVEQPDCYMYLEKQSGQSTSIQ